MSFKFIIKDSAKSSYYLNYLEFKFLKAQNGQYRLKIYAFLLIS